MRIGQKGFSLVEMLVALVIGVIVLSGVYFTYIKVSKSQQTLSVDLNMEKLKRIIRHRCVKASKRDEENMDRKLTALIRKVAKQKNIKMVKNAGNNIVNVKIARKKLYKIEIPKCGIPN